MSHSMQAGPALEQLREVVSILRELSNAGPRDQSFKQWRQVSLTLLQRIWPDDQARAARFRRIPFSPPSSRADAKTIRECYERGVCEAIAYLESLIEELENGASGRRLVRPAEAPLATPPEPRVDDTFGAEPPFVRHEPPPTAFEPPPPPAPTVRRENYATLPEPPAPPEAIPAPAPPPRLAKPDKPGRTKQRLKDMLGFGDETPAASAPRPAAPAPRPAAPAPRPAAPPPVAAAPPPPPPVVAAPPPQPPAPRHGEPMEPASHLRYEPPAPTAQRPFVPEPGPEAQFEEEPVDELPEWTAPVIPFPGHKVVVGRPSPAPPPPETFYEDDPEESYDVAFDPEAERLDGEPPPATLREMLDRVPASRASMPSRPAHEMLTMARTVDQLGVPRERRALIGAALTDLAQQMETPPADWSAIRQALTLVLEYPQIARRVIPMLLPYLDEAA